MDIQPKNSRWSLISAVLPSTHQHKALVFLTSAFSLALFSPSAFSASPDTYADCTAMAGASPSEDRTKITSSNASWTNSSVVCSQTRNYLPPSFYLDIDDASAATGTVTVNNSGSIAYYGNPNSSVTYRGYGVISYSADQPGNNSTTTAANIQVKTFKVKNTGSIIWKNFHNLAGSIANKPYTGAIVVQDSTITGNNIGSVTNNIHVNIENSKDGIISVDSGNSGPVDGFLNGIGVYLPQNTYDYLYTQAYRRPDNVVDISNQGLVQVKTQQSSQGTARFTLSTAGIDVVATNATVRNGATGTVDVTSEHLNATGIGVGGGAANGVYLKSYEGDPQAVDNVGNPKSATYLTVNNDGHVKVLSGQTAKGVALTWNKEVNGSISGAFFRMFGVINNSGVIEATSTSSENLNDGSSLNNAAVGVAISTLNNPNIGALNAKEGPESRTSYYSNITVNNSGEIKATSASTATDAADRPDVYGVYIRGVKSDTFTFNNAAQGRVIGDFKVNVSEFGRYTNNTVSGTTIKQQGLMDGNIILDAQNDTVTLDKGSNTTGTINFGTGNDTFIYKGGKLGQRPNNENKVVFGQTGNNTFINDTGTADGFQGDLNFGNGNTSYIVKAGVVDVSKATFGTGNDTVRIQSGAVIGNINLLAGDDAFNWTGGSFKGAVDLGAGNNSATISNLTAVNLANSSVPHIFSGAGTGDKLTLDNVKLSGASLAVDNANKGINFGVGWDDIALKNNAHLTLIGNLTLDDATLSIDSSSSLSTGDLNAILSALNGPLTVTNAGVIDFTNGTSGATDTLTIKGDYVGNSGKLKMNTTWNTSNGNINGLSASDKLVINGNASGSTTVIPVKADGTENIIEGNIQQVAQAINSVPTVTVSGTASKDAFTGTAATSGAAAAQLASRTTGSGGTEYYWTIRAKPVTPVTPVVADTGPVIYADSVSGYTQMPAVNMNLGYTTLGSLHERRSENQMLAWDNCGHACSKEGGVHGQSWGRVVAEGINQDGKKRLNFDTKQYLLQIGHDFAINQNHETGSRTHIGGYFSYGTADTKFSDNFHAVNGLISSNTRTGTGTSKAYTVGAYRTAYDKNGSYLDLVGQYSYISNKYSATSSHADNDANGLGLSAEVGRPYAINHSQWLIEPQAQLLYQYLDLSDINDGVRHVKYDAKSGVRGRVGARLAYNGKSNHSYMTNTFYVTANVLHDFNQDSAASALIGSDKVSENYDDTWGEFGVGMQLPVKKNIYLYGDARYAHSLNNDAGKREGVRGNLGVKFTFE